MLNSVLQMFGGSEQVGDDMSSITGIIILDLQSVLLYGTHGLILNTLYNFLKH